MTQEEAVDAAKRLAEAAVMHERRAAVAYVRASATKIRQLLPGVRDQMARFAAEHQANTLDILASKLEQGEHHPMMGGT